MKKILVIASNYSSGIRIGYEIPFEILSAARLIRYTVKLEHQLNSEDLFELDWLILYRCLHGKTLSLVRYAKKRGIQVSYELDDDLLNPPSDEVWGERHLCTGIPQIVKLFLKEADLIKVGSKVLVARLEEAGFDSIYQPYAVILREKIKLAQVPPYRIGYFGTPHHQKDLELILPALEIIVAKFGAQVEFEFFGCFPSSASKLTKVQFWEFDLDYERFLDNLAARAWTVGLAPLRATEFNKAKSDGKFRDYTAAGIVGIYSNLAPYQECVIHGENGWLCGVEVQAWADSIAAVINHADRLQLVTEARKYAQLYYASEIVAENWHKLLN